MMQRFMQEQKQPDPIPNMQYLAPGGGQAGATAMGQTAAAGTQQAEASSSAQQALVATTAECKKSGVQLEMSDPGRPGSLQMQSTRKQEGEEQQQG